jgi:hypothetical protein
VKTVAQERIADHILVQQIFAAITASASVKDPIMFANAFKGLLSHQLIFFRFGLLMIPSRYEGRNCENKGQACKSNPCLNGICIDQNGSFNCECYAGYFGETCEKRESNTKLFLIIYLAQEETYWLCLNK